MSNTYQYRYFEDGRAEMWESKDFLDTLRRAVVDAIYESAVPVQIADEQGNVVGHDDIRGIADQFSGVDLVAVTDRELLAALDEARWRRS